MKWQFRDRHINAWFLISGPESANITIRHDMRSFLWNLLSSHHTIAPKKQNISLIFLVSTIIGGNFFSAVLRLLLSFPPPSQPWFQPMVPRRRMAERISCTRRFPSVKDECERRTFRFPTRETPFKRKEITFRNECPAYICARGFLKDQVVWWFGREEGWE